MRNRYIISTFSCVLVLLAGSAMTCAQAEAVAPTSQFLPASIFSAPTPMPRMAPELALSTFDQRADHQLNDLPSYSAVTRIAAELPQSKQKAVFELERHY